MTPITHMTTTLKQLEQAVQGETSSHWLLYWQSG